VNGPKCDAGKDVIAAVEALGPRMRAEGHRRIATLPRNAGATKGDVAVLMTVHHPNTGLKSCVYASDAGGNFFLLVVLEGMGDDCPYPGLNQQTVALTS
jgi:hypothetical protein